MKYLLLPMRILRFWYPESVETFVRTWRNIILFLEEDLAVGLMWKLLFEPLFHDCTFVGRILSFFFRFFRILLGIFAFSLASMFMFALAVFWLVLPIIAVLGLGGVYSKAVLIFGIGLFFVHYILHPHKKVWQIRQNRIWEASLVKKADLSFTKLTESFEVRDLLSHLELKTEQLPKLTITQGQEDQLIVSALQLAKLSGVPYIGPAHFFVALLTNTPGVETELFKLDLRLEDFKDCLKFLDKKRQIWRMVCIWDDDFSIHHLKGVNRGWLGVPTPALDIVAKDLTRLAVKERSADFVDRGNVLEQIVRILSGQKGRDVILVGPPGAGKSALIRFLAKRILAGDAPDALATKRVMLLDLTRLISGIQTQGELADRIKAIFEEVEFARNIIIVIEEIHTLGEGEAGGSLNLYSLMQPYFESEAFQFIGTTEIENYNRILEKNGAFARLFTKVELPPCDLIQSLQVLEDRAIEIERNRKINVSFLSLKEACFLGRKLIHDRVLPDSAISLLEGASGKPVDGWITRKSIQQVVSSEVKMPIVQDNEEDKLKLLNLEQEIHKRMIDQEEAVKAVADTLRRSVTGLREENRPVGSFLFVGPTGVGKTELAKTLSEIYYKDDGAFVRFDMSEYQNPDSISRLIGGSGESGKLTQAIENRPFALILLDEFEKADQKILTLFLQVLDDGRLTDGTGKTVDFTNTIIIATSNAGSLTIAKSLSSGQRLENVEFKVREELLEIFKPELINRFDDIVLFKPLSQADLQKIVFLKLTQLKKQMERKGYLIEFKEQLVNDLASRGFDPVLGARPLRRLIQDTLEAKLSRMILENKLMKGQQFLAGVELLQ